MTVVREAHEAHGATFTTVGGHALPEHYGRPERTHHAVRRVVGVTEQAYGVVTVDGPDRTALLADLLPGDRPGGEGTGAYLLHLDDRGRVAGDAYVYDGGERVLAFTAPGTESTVAEAWRRRAAATDRSVTVALAGEAFGVFGVHGPKATEKVASVLTGPGAPDDRYGFVRGRVGDNGVTVVRSDDLAGEESYEVVCRASVAERVFDALVNHGLNAAPFGRRTWETLTLEAGTPLFETELAGRPPAALGVGHLAGAPADDATGRLVGLTPETVPDRGTAVHAAGTDEPVGTVTRGAAPPSVDGPAALAVLETPVPETVRVDGVAVPVRTLPLVTGSGRSARLPAHGQP